MHDDDDTTTAALARLVEERLETALAEHPARERICRLAADHAGVTIRPVGGGIYEAGVHGSDDEWYTLIIDTRR